jgi:hypothetical protein
VIAYVRVFPNRINKNRQTDRYERVDLLGEISSHDYDDCPVKGCLEIGNPSLLVVCSDPSPKISKPEKQMVI